MLNTFVPTTFSEYQKLYQKSIDDPPGFWSEIAENNFLWKRKWDKILDYDFEKGYTKWFSEAKLNITENCLDRYLETQSDKTAIIWEPNNPKNKAEHITYGDLHQRVCRFSNVLKKNGIQKGDRVCLYLPMVPELAIAILACARIGAVHSVIFAGFSSKSISDRINDAGCKLVICSDGSFRADKILDLKSIVDRALEHCDCVEKLIVLKHTGNNIDMKTGRDLDWHDELREISDQCEAEWMDAEDPLFILYTSGSTGKPKGMVHTCGGYMVYANYTFQTAFGYRPDDIHWCTADIGWITGHSYILYGPLSAGATTVMFEGTPSYPDFSRFWQVVDRHRVSLFYTAPTAIRSLAHAGTAFVEKADLSSLRVLGTVGEPINEEAWEWYHEFVGRGRCPIIDTWWQTETGGILISPIAGVTKTKPTYATLPLPGVQPAIMDGNGKEQSGNKIVGRLCIKYPWPGIARTIYGDHQRFIDTYFSTFKGYYFTGDGCLRDDDGYYRITGRVDDIVIVSGHNLGTAEIENAIDEHELVSEAAVVGFPHDIKGNAICAFVVCTAGSHGSEILKTEILALVSDKIGPIAKPDKIQFVSGLPKTRSGKIMRRILRKIAAGESENLGDITTLLNPEVVDEIKTSFSERKGA